MKRISGWTMVIIMLVGLGMAMTGCSEKKDAQSTGISGMQFNSMMNQLMKSMESWAILSQNDKEKAVDMIVNLFRMRENVAVLKPASFYVARIDETLATNPDMRNINLPALVRLLAIMEYDYYNGQDKEDLAKKLLGEKMYQANRKRFEANAQQLMQNQLAQQNQIPAAAQPAVPPAAN